MISSTKLPTPANTLANVPADQVATNQQAVALPWFAGRKELPLIWGCSRVYNSRAAAVTSDVGKSSRTTGYNYYGDVFGLTSCCLNDYLEQIKVGGNIVWSGFIERDGSHPDHSGDIVVAGVGTFRYYWGGSAQPADDLVLAGCGEDHPNYLDQSYLIAKDLFFGTSNTPPTISVIVERAPRFSGLDENRTREGANPVTALAEVLGSAWFGLGRPEVVDVASWSTVADAIVRSTAVPLDGDPDHVASMGYLSPFLDRQQTAQAFFADILAHFDGWLRPTGGVLELGYFPHDGAALVSPLELSYHDFVSHPEFAAADNTDASVFTDATVVYTDRDKNLQDNYEPAANLAARDRLGEIREQTYRRPFVITSYQARELASELARFYARVEESATVVVRREKVVGLRAGDRFILNDAPSSAELAVRVTQRTDPGAGGEIPLQLVVDRALAPLAWVAPPAPVPPLPPPDLASIVHARILQLPAAFFADPDPAPAVVPLAERPAAHVAGFTVNFSADDTTFDELSTVGAWALRGTLHADIVGADTTLTLDAAGLDLALLSPQSDPAAADDTLLLVCGYEILSIGAVSALGGGSYSVDVLRGRRGSAAAAHAAGDVCYVIPRDQLAIFQHADFPRDTSTRYFKLAAFTIDEKEELSTALDLTFVFDDRAVSPPSGLSATAKAEAIFLAWSLPTVADGTVDRTIVAVEIAELAHGAGAPANGPATPHDFEAYANGFNRGGLTAGTHKDYYIRTRDTIAGVSDWVGPADATAGAAPAGATGATGASGTRGSKHFYVAVTGTSWSNTDADAAIVAASLTKVLLDEVTEYKTSAGYSETRFWDGSSWLVVTQVIDGNLLVNGTVGAAKIVASTLSAISANLGTVTAGTITGVSITSTAGSIAGFTLDSNRLYRNSGSASQQMEIGFNGSAHLTLGAASVPYSTFATDFIEFRSASGGLMGSISNIGSGGQIEMHDASGNFQWGELAGVLYWGSSLDTNLYRSGANTLKTDDTFYAAAYLTGHLGVTSDGILTSPHFQADVTTAVDVGGVNFRVYDSIGGTQKARIDCTTGYYYVQGVQVVGARQARGSASLSDVVALLDAWGAWA